jgi:hypothetical protein
LRRENGKIQSALAPISTIAFSHRHEQRRVATLFHFCARKRENIRFRLPQPISRTLWHIVNRLTCRALGAINGRNDVFA